MKRILTFMFLLSFSTSFAQSRETRVRVTTNDVNYNSYNTSVQSIIRTADSIKRYYMTRVDFSRTTAGLRASMYNDSVRIDSIGSVIMPRTVINSALSSLHSVDTRDSTTIDSVRRVYTPRAEHAVSIVSLRGNIVRDSTLIDTLQKRVSKVETVSATHLLASTAMSLYQPKGMYLSLSEAAAAISAAVQLYVSNDSIGISGGNKVKLPKGFIPLTGTLTQTATVALVAGDRDVVVPIAGILSTDTRYFPNSVSPLPAGYKIIGIKSVSNGSIILTITAPLLAIGASYSIPIQITVFR